MTSSPPAAERAYEFVKNRIISGDYTQNTLLSEGDVAAAIGLSRTPVREAFLRLEVEGFLQLYPKRGALVVPIHPDDIREVFDARELIDTHCAGHICQLADAARAALGEQLTAVIAEQNAALDRGDLRDYTRLDAVFHQTIMDHGGNSILAQLGHSLRERQQRFTAAAIGRNIETARSFVEGHQRLTAALVAGDLPTYRTEIHAHLTNSRNQL